MTTWGIDTDEFSAEPGSTKVSRIGILEFFSEPDANEFSAEPAQEAFLVIYHLVQLSLVCREDSDLGEY